MSTAHLKQRVYDSLDANPETGHDHNHEPVFFDSHSQKHNQRKFPLSVLDGRTATFIIVALIAGVCGFAIPRGETVVTPQQYSDDNPVPKIEAMQTSVSHPILEQEPKLTLEAPVSEPDDIKSRLKSLAAMATEASNRVESALQQTETLQADNARLTEALTKSKAEVVAYKASLDEYDQQQTTLEDENNALRTQNGRLMIQISELKQGAKSLRKARSVLEPAEVEEAAAEPVPVESPERVGTAIKAKQASVPPKSKPAKAVAVRTNKPTGGKLNGLVVIGATEHMIVAMKDGNPVSIPVGKSWNGVDFQSVDMIKGVIHTTAGDLKISQ